MKRPLKIKKFFRDNFFSGLLVIVPLLVSIYVFVRLSVWIYRKLVFLPIDYQSISEHLAAVLPDYAVGWIVNSIHLLEFLVVLIALFILTTLAGLITKNRLGVWLLRLSERILHKIPLVGMVYSALKQLLQALFSGKGDFSRVVMIEYPRKGIWSLGFVSREADRSFSKRAGTKLISVFVPTTPNPTSGFLLMVPEADLIDLDLTIEQAFKIIISGGMVLAHEDPYDSLVPEDSRLEGVLKEFEKQRQCPPDCPPGGSKEEKDMKE